MKPSKPNRKLRLLYLIPIAGLIATIMGPWIVGVIMYRDELPDASFFEMIYSFFFSMGIYLFFFLFGAPLYNFEGSRTPLTVTLNIIFYAALIGIPIIAAVIERSDKKRFKEEEKLSGKPRRPPSKINIE